VSQRRRNVDGAQTNTGSTGVKVGIEAMNHRRCSFYPTVIRPGA